MSTYLEGPSRAYCLLVEVLKKCYRIIYCSFQFCEIEFLENFKQTVETKTCSRQSISVPLVKASKKRVLRNQNMDDA